MRLIGKWAVIPTLFFVVTSMSVYAADVQKNFTIADNDNDGRLSIDEATLFSVRNADKRADELLKKYDTNHDGCLAKDEIKEKKAQKMGLSAADANNDGSVTKEEWGAFIQKKASERSAASFQLRDANSDGFVTLEELLQYKLQLGKKAEGIDGLVDEINGLFSK